MRLDKYLKVTVEVLSVQEAVRQNEAAALYRQIQ